MKKIFLLIAILNLSIAHVNSNDGVYIMSGNQLIPVTETDISVRKEILEIRKINESTIEVTVYYEFFNPVENKSVLVGFEAMSPIGDADVHPLNGGHPYMLDFSVNMNGSELSHQIAIVRSKEYFKANNFISFSVDEVMKETGEDAPYADFFYVYYFSADFKKGMNTISHQYSFNISGSIDLGMYFDYILSAATRWANKQIDDFTLIIDMGEFQSFNINNTFFETIDEWQIQGTGKKIEYDSEDNFMFEVPATRFHIRQGNIIFKKKNFKPEGELFLYTGSYYSLDDEPFDYRTSVLPFPIRYQSSIPSAEDPVSIKILRNLPFARRGFVFKNPDIQHYFETKTDWYFPDTEYKGTMESLTKEEREWIDRFK